MSREKDRLSEFRPPDDWNGDKWQEKITNFDPDYEDILIPWLKTLPPNMLHHYVRNMDPSQGMTDRYVAFWLIDQPNLALGTARLLFWKLLDQYPYFGSKEDLEDDEHGVPNLTRALLRLVDRLKTGAFAETGLAVTPAELRGYTERHEQNRGFARERGRDAAQVPFNFPDEWATPIAGKPPSVPAKFPAPEDPLVAVFLMSSNFPTRKEMFQMAEKYDVIEGSDRLILWGAYAACAVFVLYGGYSLWR